MRATAPLVFLAASAGAECISRHFGGPGCGLAWCFLRHWAELSLISFLWRRHACLNCSCCTQVWIELSPSNILGEHRVERWPELPYTAWKDTCATLHLWTQIVGKTRLALTPWLNHSWHVTLYVTARGLTTSLISSKTADFEIAFDFVDHVILVRTSNGQTASAPLKAMTVADFYARYRTALAEL